MRVDKIPQIMTTTTATPRAAEKKMRVDPPNPTSPQKKKLEGPFDFQI